MGHLDWHGDEFLQAVESAVSVRLEAAAGILRDNTRQLISIQGPPRSKPFEPSHKDSGDMYESMTVRGGGLRYQVGSPLDYYVYQNLGTGYSAKDVTRTKHYNKPTQIVGHAPRPSAVPGLMQSRGQIVETVLEGMTQTA